MLTPTEVPQKPPRPVETYEVRCHGCEELIELPAAQPVHKCPRCGTRLEIRWGRK